MFTQFTTCSETNSSLCPAQAGFPLMVRKVILALYCHFGSHGAFIYFNEVRISLETEFPAYVEDSQIPDIDG